MTHMVLVDGLDRTGKDTLVNEILIRTNYEHLFMNRGIISSIAYAVRYNRPKSHIQGYVEILKSMQEGLGDKLVTLFVDCDEDTINERIVATGHKEVDLHADAYAFIRAIEIVKKEVPDHKIVYVDSTDKTPQELCDEVLEVLR